MSSQCLYTAHIVRVIGKLLEIRSVFFVTLQVFKYQDLVTYVLRTTSLHTCLYSRLCSELVRPKRRGYLKSSYFLLLTRRGRFSNATGYKVQSHLSNFNKYIIEVNTESKFKQTPTD